MAAPRPSLQSKKSEKGGPGRNCFSPPLTVKKAGKMGDSRVQKSEIFIFAFHASVWSQRMELLFFFVSMNGSTLYTGISTEQWIQWAKDGKLGDYDKQIIAKYADKETMERIFSAVRAPTPPAAPLPRQRRGSKKE